MENWNHSRYDREFDRRYAYDGALGAACTPERTVFKLWSPEAERVELFLYRDGTGSEAHDRRTLTPGERGVWSAAVEGDLLSLIHI